jgi:hypothetical protein
MDGLARAAGHEDRHTSLKSYVKRLLLPGERKSIEPMAARMDPAHVQPMRQSSAWTLGPEVEGPGATRDLLVAVGKEEDFKARGREGGDREAACHRRGKACGPVPARCRFEREPAASRLHARRPADTRLAGETA